MIGRETLREFAINAVLVALSVSLVLSGLEVALQVGLLSIDKTQHQYCDGPVDRYRFHPQYGYTEHPNSVYLEKKTAKQDWSLFVQNDEGFRDVYNRGDERVLVLGDSFTRGTLVDQNATFTHLLDRWNRNTSFRNYGVAGYDQTNQLQVYENVSERYDHKLVVIGFFMNDALTNDLNSSRRPTYVLEDGEPKLVRLPEPTPTITESSVFRQIYFKTPLRHLITPQFLVAKWQAVNQRLKRDRRTVPKPPEGEELQDKLNLTRALLDEIATQSAKHDAEVLVVVLPTRGDVNPDRPQQFLVEDGRPYWNANREMLRTLAENNANVSVLDPRAALRRERAAGNRVYGIQDGHLDEAGHRTVAAEIQEYLMQSGYVGTRTVDWSKQYDTDRAACP